MRSRPSGLFPTSRNRKETTNDLYRWVRVWCSPGCCGPTFRSGSRSRARSVALSRWTIPVARPFGLAPARVARPFRVGLPVARASGLVHTLRTSRPRWRRVIAPECLCSQGTGVGDQARRGTTMFATLGRTWDLTKLSWRVLKKDRELVFFPVFAAVGMLILAGLMTGIGASTGTLARLDGGTEQLTGVDVGLLAITYFLMGLRAHLLQRRADWCGNGPPGRRRSTCT